jgi:hypothetical protein
VPRRQPAGLPNGARPRSSPSGRAPSLAPCALGAILGRPASSVGKVLRRHGQSRLPRPPRPPARRYERARPGELLHVDTKRLGRFHQVGKRVLGDDVRRSRSAGWHYLHVAVDDHTRLAYCEALPGQGGRPPVASLAAP